MKNSDVILHKFLVESGDYSESDFVNLHEDTKTDAIRTIASSLMKEIIATSEGVDTTLIDQSRGDIRNLRDLESIQVALSKIDSMLDSANALFNQGLVKDYITAVTKSIFYLNQYTSQFKDGYRMKKSVVILRYQTVVIAIMSCVAYLFSSLVDFSSGKAELKSNPKLDETSALRVLKQFINSADNGELRLIMKDVNTVRESYNENSLEVMSTIQEASDIFSTTITGLKNLYNNLDKGGRVTNLIYKAVGIIAALYPMRELFAMLLRSRYKVRDIFDGVRNFANSSALNSLNRLQQFGSRFRVDAEENSKLAQRDVESSNKEIATQVKELPEPDAATSVASASDYTLQPKANVQSVPSMDDFFFM